MPTGADLFVDAIQSLGISRIFTLVGDHLNEVLAVAARRGVTIVDMRHESGVTHTADAWARLTRKPALSLVTGGPGHTNSLTGLATAFQAASPLIAVSGSPAAGMAGRQVFQVIEQVGMAAPVSKWSAQPATAGQIPYYLGKAYAEALSGRMGPVHLTVPVDLFTATTDTVLPMPAPPPRPAMNPDSNEVDRALDLLRKAERPIVIAGSGVWWGGAEEELREFLERTNLPYYSITMARGVLPDTASYALGYADGALNKAVHKAFPMADVCLVLGKRIDYRLALGGARLFSPAAKFIQVDLYPQELGTNRKLEVGICADVKSTLRAFVNSLGNEWWSRPAWMQQVRGYRQDWETELASRGTDRSSPIHPAAFYHTLRDALPADVLYSWDGGDFAHWGRAILPATQRGGWLRLGPLGTIGSALPNSIALQMANPGRPVAMITGDGSLGFYIAELDTLVRYNLPVVIIVGNDAGWGLERELQSAATGIAETVACELRPTRYDLVMKGFGGEGENIESLDQVAPAVQRAFASGKPYLLNVNIRGVRSPFTEWQIAGKKR
jgi:acetolactate synthase-1/2/3 large subunit